MATTRVVWREGMHFCTKVLSGEVMCDESSDIGAAYPSSPELLMASLGSCIASVLVYYAERHGIDLEGMHVDLDWKIAENPHRIGAIDVRVGIPHKMPESQKAVLERVAHTCLIHNTLTHPPDLSLELQTGASRAAAH